MLSTGNHRALRRSRCRRVFMTDDCSQGGLLIAPELWQSMFKPYYQRVFDEVHKLGMDVIFHSCGNVFSIIGDLIDIGMDVLDPVQPGAMDIDLVARNTAARSLLRDRGHTGTTVSLYSWTGI